MSSTVSTQRSALSTQRWLCLSVTVPYEAAEAVANFLAELGSLGVVEGVRDLLHPEATTTEVQGFFAEDTEQTEISGVVSRYLRDLRELIPGVGSPTPHFTTVTDGVWQERWKEHFPPLAVGKHFLLLPPWEPCPAETDRLPIIIEPSMAFGTGHHATTQGCLEAIELLLRQYGPPSAALDLGTGSGILAIALAKLGATQIWATDIDPIALDEARKNSARNQVFTAIQFSDLPVDQLPSPFTLIVANLFSNTLIALALMLGVATASRGHVILSGIQLDQESDVLAAYPSPAWTLISRFPKDEWVTLILQHR